MLGMVCMCAYWSHYAKLEPIIGAFLAGVAFNRLIPAQSTLMNRLIFVEEYDNADEVEALYEEAFCGELFSTNAELCSDGTLLIHGEKRCVVPLDEEKIAWEEMYLIV